MKKCPNCQAEMEESFDVCWKCNYSISEQKIINYEEEKAIEKREINCLRCDVPMIYSGNYKFHEGFKFGLFGNLMEAFVNKESFDLHLCPKCGKVEFFTPLNKN